MTVAGAGSSTRAIPITFADASLFLNYSLSLPVTTANPPDFIAFALNADGSINSPANPAPLGSTISVFVNGLVTVPGDITGPLKITATPGWTVSSFRQMTPYVYQVNLQVPAVLAVEGYPFSCPPGQAPLCTAGLTLYYTFGWQNWTAINSGSSGSATVYVKQ